MKLSRTAVLHLIQCVCGADVNSYTARTARAGGVHHCADYQVMGRN
jgi:hypothetical protein